MQSSCVIAMEIIDIPAKHEIIEFVKAKLTRKVYAEENSKVFEILCPDSNFIRKYWLSIGRVLVNASRSHIYSIILNPCDTDVIIYKRKIIKEWTVCHVLEMDTDLQQIPEYKVEMYSDGRKNLT